jgi:Protein of unknown function (DUF3592)
MSPMTDIAISLFNTPNFVYLIPLWPLVFIGVWAIWNMVRDSRNEKLVEHSLAWPEVHGKVVSSKVAWAHVEVKYEYSISSGQYTGKYKINLSVGAPDRYGQTATRMNQEAKQDIADFPTGADVIIRYNPQQPAQSVLYWRSGISGDGTGRSSGIPLKLFTLS